MADDVSSPERMDFSEESSFEMSPLNHTHNHHTRPNQQLPQRKPFYGNRRMSCPPPLSPLTYPNESRSKPSKRKSTGDFLDMIGQGFTGMQLESPPGDLRKHAFDRSEETSSNVSTVSGKRFFSLPSFGLGSVESTNSQDKNVDECSDDSNSTIVSGSSGKQDSNNNGKVYGIKRRPGFGTKLSSCKAGDMSTIMDESDSAENDDDGRMSTISSTSSKTTRHQRLLVKQNANLSGQKSRLLCYLHSLMLCSTVVLVGYFGSQEMHRQWCSSRQTVNITRLQDDLVSKVFGQHVATDLIVRVFQDFVDSNHRSQPPVNSLVFSFHGWTGVGKNYVSSIIADLIPSTSVFKLIIPLHFPYSGVEYSEQYKENIKNWILTNISDCTLNLFIIDEMDKATKPILQGLQNAVESIKSEKWNHTKVVILLLSNTGGTVINKVLFDHLSDASEREALVYSTVQEAVLDDPVATWHKELYRGNLIDHIVPFLPLQPHHVEMCVRNYLKRRDITLPNKTVLRIVQDFEYFPPGNPMFSKSGCKRVESKTDLYI